MNVLVLDLRLSVVDSVQRLEGDGFPVKACQRQMTRLSTDLGFCSPSARPSSTCLLRNQSAVEYDKDNAENEGSYSRHMGDEMQRRKRIFFKNIARKKKVEETKTFTIMSTTSSYSYHNTPNCRTSTNVPN